MPTTHLQPASRPGTASAAPSLPSLLIIIVNYHSADLVLDCLASLAPELNSPALGPVHITITDNASGDGSVEKLAAALARQQWGGAITLLPLPKNGGFAYGNNAPLRAPSAPLPDYVLLLNPDTVVRPGALAALVDFMERNPHVGIAGSRLEDPDTAPQKSAFRFPSVLAELDDGCRLGFLSRLLSRWRLAPAVRNEPHETDWVAGASMIIRRNVLQTVGLLDEAYFMYFEEVDFCRRAKLAGFSCWYVPASRVVHLVGRVSGVTVLNEKPKRRPAYWFESRQRYFVRHHGLLYTALADAAWIFGYTFWLLRRLVLPPSAHRDPPHLLRDFLRHSVFLRPRAALRQRKTP